MPHPSRVRMSGPLVPYQDAIWTDLLARGYTRLSAKNVLRVAAHLSQWLQAESVSPDHLTRDRIDAFLGHRRAQGYTCWLSPRGLEPVLTTLRARNVAPPAEPAPEEEDSPLARVLREYECYLLEDRALVPCNAQGYVRTARRFFAEVGVDELADVRRLTTADISGFVLREARTMATGTAKLTVTRLRALLRYLHVRGLCTDLSTAVPAVAGHRHARLPKHIPWREVQQLLKSCDLRTAVGRRDHAILLLLARLGLRAGEVAGIELDDINWAEGKIVVRGKGSQDWLPLPEDVGEAIVRYLKRGRPSSHSRKLFIAGVAPYGDLSASAIMMRVRVASRRAHLPPRSAHRLRHTAATQMLRGGASLQEVAEVLRHRSLDTTAIYAKVDHLALRPLARPWPGGAS